MINAEAIDTVDPRGWGRSLIDIERTNSQLSLLREKVIASVDPGGMNAPLRHSVLSTGWLLVVHKNVLRNYQKTSVDTSLKAAV